MHRLETGFLLDFKDVYHPGMKKDETFNCVSTQECWNTKKNTIYSISTLVTKHVIYILSVFRDEQDKRHDGPPHTKRIVREGADGR